MITVLKADGVKETEYMELLKKRSQETDKKITQAVTAILESVKNDGDKALDECSRRFDGCPYTGQEISAETVEKAYQDCDAEFIKALQAAHANIYTYHMKQKRQSFVETQENGVILGQKIKGLQRVGVYVPGGTAAYPSSVLMNVIPAKIAGVGEIIMITPPQKGGEVDKNILAAAKIAGVDRIFSVGGAHGVAALAYGTASIPMVDKIVGPGNIYVATAKKLLFGTVDIDMVAGPSEILIMADQTANPAYLAADLMSQAEHDVLASSILLTTSESIATETVKELTKQVESLSRKEIILKSLKDFGMILVCDSTEQMIDYASELAPEHLEVCMENPMEYIGVLDTAGSIFLGHYSPEPLGDYYAGPNHVLPTGGTARFFSPLGVDAFIKKSSFIYYTQEALRQAKADIICLAEHEGLTAHANSIKVRN